MSANFNISLTGKVANGGTNVKVTTSVEVNTSEGIHQVIADLRNTLVSAANSGETILFGVDHIIAPADFAVITVSATQI